MDKLKEKAKELSHLLMTEPKDMVSINNLFKELETVSLISKDKTKSKSNDNDKSNIAIQDTIGIWVENIVNGKKVFQRDTKKTKEWSSWANTTEISPKSYKKRVVLLGESVARGYFYAPKYSVASELESVLTQSKAFNGIEVIDLSKNSINIEELSEVVQSSNKLEPDVMLLFAGNNWIHKLYHQITPEDYKEMAIIYEKELFSGVKVFLEQKFEKIVTEFLDTIIQTSKANKIPMVLVIPGFNLLDWKSDEEEKILPIIPNGNIKSWLEAKEKAEKSISQQDYEELEFQSKKMIEIDPSNPMGFELLAESYLKNGKISEAIDCLDESKDTIIFGRGINPKPRCFKIIRDTILKRASKEDIPVVDLFSLFKDVYPEKVSDKELYLDYCHLSAEGIKTGAKYMAKAIIETMNNEKVDVSSIPESIVKPDNFTKAIAHFSAAIHNAHYSQPKYVLKYHCQKAISFDPGIKDVMLQYIDFSSRKTSSILCSSFEEILKDGAMQQYEGGMALMHPRYKKMMDIDLIDSIVEALKSIGYDYEREVTRLRISEHGVTDKPINLLESFYRLKGYNSYNNPVEKAFLEIRNEEKTFNFITDAKDDLQIEIVYKNSNHITNGDLNIYLNTKEQKIDKLEVTHDWNKVIIKIPKKLLNIGVNTLIMEWPINNHSTKLTEHNDMNFSIDTFFPVIGMIYSLMISNDVLR